MAKASTNKAAMATAMLSAFGVNLSVYDKCKATICPLAPSELPCALLFEHTQLPELIAKKCCGEGNAFFYSNSFNCFWHVFSTIKNNEPKIYVVGPVLISSVSENQVALYFYQRVHSQELVKSLTNAYARATVVSYPLFVQLVSLIYQYICGVAPNSEMLGVLSCDKSDYQFKINNDNIYKIQQRDFALSIKNEQFLRDCVRSGDVERLKQINDDDTQSVNLSPLAPSELRSFKNNLVAYISLITRHAIEGGLPVETAFPLSDLFIMKIELAADLATTLKVSSGAALEFASRVKENRFKLQYSAIVNKCCGYIVSHVNAPLRVAELAKIANLHPDTLERRFKKDTGIAITEYIRNVKMDEAKMLLKYTQKSLTEICYDLGYTSQSQFIINFKKCFNTTPNAYRKSHC